MTTTTNEIVIDSGELPLPTSSKRQCRQCRRRRPRSIVWTASLVVTTTVAFAVVIFGQHLANAYNIVKNDRLSPVSNRRRLQPETETSRQLFFDRRTLLNQFVTITSAATATTLLLPPNTQPAYGRNLPKSTGADISNTGTVHTLIPILQIKCIFQSLIEKIRTSHKDSNRLLPSFLTSTPSSSSSLSSSQLLFGIPTQEDPFKRLFDEYSVPVSYKQKYLDSNAFLVYYTKGFDGIGRPNIEQQQQGQGAGDSSAEDAIVNEIQTIQYGSRNEVWVAWESFQAEYSYFRSTFMTAPSSSSSSTSSSTSSSLYDDRNESLVEMIKYLEDALKALDTYLRLVPEEQLREAATKTSSCSV